MQAVEISWTYCITSNFGDSSTFPVPMWCYGLCDTFGSILQKVFHCSFTFCKWNWDNFSGVSIINESLVSDIEFVSFPISRYLLLVISFFLENQKANPWPFAISLYQSQIRLIFQALLMIVACLIYILLVFSDLPREPVAHFCLDLTFLKIVSIN